MKKRILSLLLALVLAVGLLPSAVFAEGRSQRDNFLAVAASQVGYRETYENDNKYGTWYGVNNQPWCAIFISWCARKAGVSTSAIPNFAGTITGTRQFKQLGEYISLSSNPSYIPQPGDIVFLDGLEEDGTRDGVPDHVAIVEYCTDTEIHTIEGNTAHNMVERLTRPRNEAVLGYASPNFGTISAPAGSIKVANVVSPSGTWNGSSFSVSGTVSSSSKITWLYCDIRDAAGNFYSAAQASPNSYTANISSLDSYLRFGTLGPGNYWLYVEAVDASYNFVQKSYPFSVGLTDVDLTGRHACFADAINWSLDNCIANGTSGGRFSPDDNCTRAQVVTFLWRAAGRPAPKKMDKCSFNDVADGSFYCIAVQWALEQGITLGVGGNRFAPNASVTREQFVTFLWRYLNMPAADGEVPFTDLNENAFSYNAIIWAYSNGVTAGTGGDCFSPKLNATRAQVVTFIYRALEQPLDLPEPEPEPSPEPDPSETPEPSPEPDPGETAEPSTDPDPSEAPEPSPEPESVEATEPSETSLEAA